MELLQPPAEIDHPIHDRAVLDGPLKHPQRPGNPPSRLDHWSTEEETARLARTAKLYDPLVLQERDKPAERHEPRVSQDMGGYEGRLLQPLLMIGEGLVQHDLRNEGLGERVRNLLLELHQRRPCPQP